VSSFGSLLSASASSAVKYAASARFARDSRRVALSRPAQAAATESAPNQPLDRWSRYDAVRWQLADSASATSGSFAVTSAADPA